MKTRRYILFAMAALAFASCEKAIEKTAENEPSGEISTITFSATMDGKAPDSKAVIGTNPETGKPLNFWVDGDEITVYSQGKGDSGTQSGFTFSTTLVANASSADFTYTGDGWVDGTAYMAIYPATGSRAVNFTAQETVAASGEYFYRMAAVDVPYSQTLVANSFDRNAMVATAYSTDNTFAFKSAVALLKFQVSGTDVVSGTIVSGNDESISGRFRADLSATSPYEPVLYSYQPTWEHNFIYFTIDDSTPLSTGTNYYVAVRPTTLSSGFKIYLNGKLVKTFTPTELVRNKIYNLGTLSVPVSTTEMALGFNFGRTALTGWPTVKDDATKSEGGQTCTFPLYGASYSFLLADPTGASGANIWWNSGIGIQFNAAQRYLGLPAIENWKLSHVTVVHKDAVTKKSIIYGIVSNRTNASTPPTSVSSPETVEAEATTVTTTRGNHISCDFAIPSPVANTQYYVYRSGAGASYVPMVLLTYVPE